MKLRLNNPIDKAKGIDYFKKLLDNGSFIELRNIPKLRTNQQNRYMHLLFAWFAIEYGENIPHVKQEVFKKVVNEPIFKTSYTNTKTGVIRVEWRSTASLDSKELTLAIDRFRNWSATNGIYLPMANEDEFLKHIEIEIEKHKEYI